MQLKNVFLVVICFVSSMLVAQTNSGPDAEEIGKVMKMQEEAWNEGNAEKFMQGYWNSDSLTFVGKNGVTFGWKQTLANYKKNYPDKETMGKLVFTIIKKEKLGDENFLVIGKWHLTRSKDEVGGHFSLIWKKINGKWVIISDHTS
ncbi:MAG: YybH family protein [Bacteroidia bacterium]